MPIEISSEKSQVNTKFYVGLRRFLFMCPNFEAPECSIVNMLTMSCYYCCYCWLLLATACLLPGSNSSLTQFSSPLYVIWCSETDSQSQGLLGCISANCPAHNDNMSSVWEKDLGSGASEWRGQRFLDLTFDPKGHRVVVPCSVTNQVFTLYT
jgi:hypothetical protein